jgi:hypothetical protein
LLKVIQGTFFKWVLSFNNIKFMCAKFWSEKHLGGYYIDEGLFNLFLKSNGFFKRRYLNTYEIVLKENDIIKVIHLFEMKYFVIKYLIDNNVSKYVFSVIDKKKYFNINLLTEIENE